MTQRLRNSWVAPLKVFGDAVFVSAALWLAYWLRYGQDIPVQQLDSLRNVWVGAIVLKLLVFALLGNYATVWRYASINDLLRLFRSVLFASLLLVAFVWVLELNVPAEIVLLDAVLSMALCGFGRMLPRIAQERVNPTMLAALPGPIRSLLTSEESHGQRRILIAGAGDAGESLVREMCRKGQLGYLPVGFVDDDVTKRGMRIHGVKVRGSREDIPRLVAQHDVDEILIAIPSATAEQIRPIADICRFSGVKVKILPDIASLVDGPPRLSDLRELRIEDLLGRPRIELHTDSVSAYLRGKVVLVTGAGGSIGSELCRQILRYAPAEIHLFGRGENSIFAIYQELQPRRGDTRITEIIGDVINKKKLIGIFERIQPDIVFHAGADKHVPLMELNPDEAVLNNILGTRNVIEACNEFGVERLVCISTDKAVNPTSIMGCCKRVAELYVRSPRYQKTVITAVRFGNVLGSRGSVIPLFRKQIERGGPVTVTHKDVRRYFMTIPEAVALVIQAGAMAAGKEVFVLDMGEPVKIDDLARRVIRLSGYEPDKDIEVSYCGLRPGEKLDEELVGVGESREPTAHQKIFKVRIRHSVTDADLDAQVGQLIRQAVEMDDVGIRESLKRLVPEYQPYLPPEVESWTTKRN